MIYREHDGVLLREVYREVGELTSKLSQPGRDAILAHNAEVRKMALKQGGQALRLICNIPELDRMILRRTHPELDAPDTEIRNRAWAKFFASSESAIYKV